MPDSQPTRPGLVQDKIAIVTGAAEGIGEAIAHKFAYEGAGGLVLAGLPGDPLDQVAADVRDQYGTRVETFAGDVGEPEHAEACVQKAVDAFGRLDVLVNNAGSLPALAELPEYPVEAFDKLLHNNVKTTFFMTRAAVPELQKTKGNVVTAGSEAGWNGSPRFTPYGGTKAWNHAFMKGVAGEQGAHGVRANCVCPGPVDTSFTHKEDGPMDKDAEQTVTQSTAFGRRATTEEIANVYAFLASDQASYVTGALWLVDGATTIVHGMPGKKAPKDVQQEPAGVLTLRFQRHSDPAAVPAS
ncbi:glucose 1-dehydrogenase [Rubrivirga sp. S365]|uniref:Glucose 1-dehydrogenase n=1 Tax=Rubrivirga litoralis TaxID=3075598 RepID=A0ABU3BP37_9BACT|nr:MULTISPECIES: glucose 1-dehydrogenase [unclassified Rubrivirga]MDT0631064.1 glucose 1-dehydrogenase [Rubrivirga sp. F394]MDT7855424.1 glucose 1-dehydrogenase [Rubrivirga sp. S365]